MQMFSSLPNGARSPDTTRSQLSGSFNRRSLQKINSLDQDEVGFYEVGDVQLNCLLEGQLQYLQYTHKTYERIRMYRNNSKNSSVNNNTQCNESAIQLENSRRKNQVVILGSEDERDQTHMFDNDNAFMNTNNNNDDVLYDVHTQHFNNFAHIILQDTQYVENDTHVVHNENYDTSNVQLVDNEHIITDHINNNTRVKHHNNANDDTNKVHYDTYNNAYNCEAQLSQLNQQHCRKQKVLDWVMKMEDSFIYSLDSEDSLNEFEYDEGCNKQYIMDNNINNIQSDINMNFEFEDSSREIKYQQNGKFFESQKYLKKQTKTRRKLRLGKWFTACFRAG